MSFLLSLSLCWFDPFVSIPYATHVSLTLSVSDVPIEPALFSVSFLGIPTSTWEASSIGQEVDVSQVLRPVRLQCMC
jgi:hypothetical protein